MKPLGIKHIDLVDVLLERGVTGFVVGNVKGGAQTFAGVEGNFRGFASGFAARGTALGGLEEDVAVREGLEIVFGGWQQQFGEMLCAQYIEDESGQHERDHHGGCVEDAPEPLPSLALGIEKYLFIGHDRSLSFYVGENGKTLHGRGGARDPTLYSTKRMEAGAQIQWTELARKVLRMWPQALALGAGLWLRLWMLGAFPQVNGDTLIYGDLAKNLLRLGHYAHTDASGVVHETLIRLPGYPLFLAACFKLFGMENYNAAVFVQIALELAGCLLLAGFVQRIAPESLKGGAAMGTLWLGALCPFTASYAVAPLTETVTLFASRWRFGLRRGFRRMPGWASALAFTFAVTFAALLRPDGALVALALAPAMALARKTSCRRTRAG